MPDTGTLLFGILDKMGGVWKELPWSDLNLPLEIQFVIWIVVAKGSSFETENLIVLVVHGACLMLVDVRVS